MDNEVNKDSVLRIALRGNAWFLVVLGTAFFLAARPVADVIGLTSALGAPLALGLMFGTGAILVLGGAGMFSLLRKPIVDRWLAGIATGADALWVLGTILLFGIAGSAIPGAGRWLLGGIAPIAALIAALMAYAMWRTRPTDTGHWHGRGA